METKAYPSNGCGLCLSEDLITHEILVRLPLKSLVRLKTVCKLWYSILKDPAFAKKHLQFTRHYSSSHLVIRSDDTMFTLHLDLNNIVHSQISCMQGKFIPLYPKFLKGTLFQNIDFKLHRDFGVIGSCNGLICFHIFSKMCIFIWNPTIDEYRSILPPYSSANWHYSLCLCGFGYTLSTNDYKIVLVTLRKVESKPCRFVHVYSLRENKWRELNNFDQLSLKLPETKISMPSWREITKFKEAVLLNDSMYWYIDLAYATRFKIYQRDKLEGRFIIKFDMVKETFEIVADLKKIHRGNKEEKRYLYSTELGVTGDNKLCIVERYNEKYRWDEDCNKSPYVVEFRVLDECSNAWNMKRFVGEVGNIGLTKKRGLVRMITGDANFLIYEIECPIYMGMDSLLVFYCPRKGKGKGKGKGRFIEVKNEYCKSYKSGVDVVGVVNYVLSLVSPNYI